MHSQRLSLACRATGYSTDEVLLDDEDIGSGSSTMRRGEGEPEGYGEHKKVSRILSGLVQYFNIVGRTSFRSMSQNCASESIQPSCDTFPQAR